jgi:hypothetical protein
MDVRGGYMALFRVLSRTLYTDGAFLLSQCGDVVSLVYAMSDVVGLRNCSTTHLRLSLMLMRWTFQGLSKLRKESGFARFVTGTLVVETDILRADNMGHRESFAARSVSCRSSVAIEE